MGSLAGLVGLDAADGLGGGPPDRADVLVVQVDGDRLVGILWGRDRQGAVALEGAGAGVPWKPRPGWPWRRHGRLSAAATEAR